MTVGELALHVNMADTTRAVIVMIQVIIQSLRLLLLVLLVRYVRLFTTKSEQEHKIQV